MIAIRLGIGKWDGWLELDTDERSGYPRYIPLRRVRQCILTAMDRLAGG